MNDSRITSATCTMGLDANLGGDGEGVNPWVAACFVLVMVLHCEIGVLGMVLLVGLLTRRWWEGRVNKRPRPTLHHGE